MSATSDSYLNALLALSGNAPLAGITQKFDKDFLSTEYRKKIYHSTLRVKEKYVKNGCCINWRQAGQKVTSCNYSNADGNSERACDYCIRTKRLCARLVKVKEEISCAIYPLPAGFRARTAKWDDMEYWVQD
jgi:hypothetical protein